MKVCDYEIIKFSENKYTEIKNNGKSYLLNKEPYLDIVLTDRCNSNCNFCIADLIHKKLDCSINTFKEKILFAVSEMNVREVLILGGEPTVSKDLMPIVKWLKGLDLDKIVMTTNGIRLATSEKYREEVMSSGVTHINLSLMSVDMEKQRSICNSKRQVSVMDVRNIYKSANANGVKLRINNNVFIGNNDSLDSIVEFYEAIRFFCDSVKFSPILEVDDFSVINEKTAWAKQNRLSDSQCLKLFERIQDHYSYHHNVSVIENESQFGFVKNTMIPLRTPIILNWNFGEYTGMMDKVVNERKINNIKLLPNNELSLSWNRELDEYFINTDKS